jgi:hypothetical protein
LAERVAEAMNYAPTRRRAGIPLRPDPGALESSDRQSFHRALAARVFAHMHAQMPEDVVARAFPADDKAAWITKASVSPDSAKTGEDAGAGAIEDAIGEHLVFKTHEIRSDDDFTAAEVPPAAQFNFY